MLPLCHVLCVHSFALLESRDCGLEVPQNGQNFPSFSRVSSYDIVTDVALDHLRGKGHLALVYFSDFISMALPFTLC